MSWQTIYTIAVHLFAAIGAVSLTLLVIFLRMADVRDDVTKE